MSQSDHQDGGGAGTPMKPGGPPGRKPLRERSVTLTLSLPKAIFGLFFAIFVLVWVFIFGVMLGRGHNPEDIVPELAKVMPAPSSGQPSADETMNEVLQPQDLKYHETLKGKGSTEKPVRPDPPAPQAPAPRTPTPAKPSAPEQARNKPAQTQPVAKPSAPRQETAPSQDPDRTVYNYIYQVAAFNNAAAAESMQKKLLQGGLSAKIAQTESKGTTWFRILVSFKGSPEDTRTLRSKLAAYGISAIILRGKVPAK